jgi:hypothetical protein
MWQLVEKDKFNQFIDSIVSKNKGKTVKVVNSIGFVNKIGAFVSIECKEDAENLYLSDICVIKCENPCKSYEELLCNDFAQGCFVTAESKTADIEKKLVSGVHGPKECIFVVLQ